MSYDKKTWVNDKTKLNATNMNHLEDGLSDIDAKITEVATIASNALAEAKAVTSTVSAISTKADSAVLMATTANATATKAQSSVLKKQDILVSGSNIKTINGKSVLGSGNLVLDTGGSTVTVSETGVATDSIQYITVNGEEHKLAGLTDFKHETKTAVKLNSLLDRGIYEITGALDNPDNTSVNGTLIVDTLNDSKVHQEWLSDSNVAVRITDGQDTPIPVERYTLTVVDETGNREIKSSASDSQLEVQLNAGHEYVISGKLAGRIVIGDVEEVTANTKLMLNDVVIHSTYSSAIEYMPTKKHLTVVIAAGTSNLVVCDEKDQTGRTSTAAIYAAESDIILTGTGTLYIEDKHGHSVKSSELTINGEPNITATAGHDAFHASKILRMTGGTMNVVYANDAFSAGSDSDLTKITCEMTITGGAINITKLEGAIFETKSSNKACKYRILNTQISTSTNISDLCAETTGGNLISIFDTAVVNGISENEKLVAQYEVRKKAIKDLYDTVSVKFVDADGVSTTVSPSGTVYALSQSKGYGHYIVTGDLTGYSFVSSASTEDIDVWLNGIYYNDLEAEKQDSNNLFEYINTAGRLELNFNATGINYIKKAKGSLFKSAGNISLKTKADDATEVATQSLAICYLTAVEGAVIEASDGRSAIAGDGIVYITDSYRGVYVSCLWLGNEYSKAGAANWSKANLAAYIKNNTTDALIKYKESDTDKKKYGYLTATYYLLGTCIIGDTVAYESSGKYWIEALSGTVDDLYMNTALVFCADRTTKFDISTNVAFYDPSYIGEKQEDIHIDDEGGVIPAAG